ncbi:MAG: DUF4178 domain-containing protein [Pseudomonadota bacterium]
MATSPQRAYRAACPNCGAPVEFASAASASAVCSFCRSTLVRDGEALRRIGISAELFDDHSPLQLGANGPHQGVAFTLVGRLQYGYPSGPAATAAPTPSAGGAGPGGGAAAALGGTWNEWHALFDNGRSAWLSEDNGAYVLAFDAPLPPDAPPLDGRLAAGQRVLAGGRAWDVASVARARLVAAQGELPSPPRLDGDFLVADLRNAAGDVATLDGSDPRAVHWSIGRSVLLAELRLQGLADVREKTLSARSIGCPSCGAALEPRLATTQSLTCGQCKAVVDISRGVGAELAFHAQSNSGDSGFEPQIPLGRTGTLALGPPGTAPAPWQVVGYLERCDIPDDPEEDTTFWREYLLYHATLGFAFLVDSEDGWSWVRPITGAPERRGDGARWQGVDYRRTYSYRAKVTWVLGEFYWRVRREEEALVSDYVGTGAASDRRLSREQTHGSAGTEVVWSAGATLDAAAVAQAFGLASSTRAALERKPSPDVRPVSDLTGSAVRMVALIIFILVIVSILSQCGDDDCDSVRTTFGANSNEYRQCLAQRGSGTSGRVGGGSYGGWSSGGGHK